MERWLIEISDEQLEQLPLEQRDLGTLTPSGAGGHYLVFRDGFVALKVANRLGVKRSACRSLPTDAAPARLAEPR